MMTIPNLQSNRQTERSQLEMTEEILELVRAQARNNFFPPHVALEMRVMRNGAHVIHPKYGRGVVIGSENALPRVQVRFSDSRTRTISAHFLRLEDNEVE